MGSNIYTTVQYTSTPPPEPVVVCAVHPCGQLVSLDASCIGYVLQKSAEEEVEESCIGAQRDH